MPVQLGGAQRASLRRTIHGRVHWLRAPRTWLAALSLALIAPLAPPSVTDTTNAIAATRCGGWRSTVKPPGSIRVLRTATGEVERVHFTTYVATVMASGEWPSRLPRAALEAGATAVKQYAWYYRLRGHHRSWYRTRDGQCYDVRDDTMDQLYRPESARPTQKQLDAVAATWGLSLRKRGRFFLTGYRAGVSVGCARDRDGWHLFAASVARCARQGWSRQRIQRTYYAPRLRFVWDLEPAPTVAALAVALLPATVRADRRAPIATAPTIGLRPRGTLDGAPIGVIRWGGADAGSGLTRFQVQLRDDGGPWRDVRLDRPTDRHATFQLRAGHRYQARVRSIDRAGHRSRWAGSRLATTAVRQQDAARLRGSWALVASDDASGGSLRRTASTGEQLSFRYRGRGVGIVAPTGPGHGTVRVRSSKDIVTLDLGKMRPSKRRLIWVRAYHRVTDRRLRLRVVSTPGTSRVAIDAFVVIR